MKRKILCALLALCLFASLLPLTAMAAGPDITVVFLNNDESAINVTLKPGDPTKYITTTAEGWMSDWTDAENAPSDNFIKLDYPADDTATLKVTFQNVYADSYSKKYHHPAIEFSEGAYSINLELVGTNKIVDGHSACIKYNNDGGMTITGTEGSSLSLHMGKGPEDENHGAAAATLWANGGDLKILNTTLNFEVYTYPTSQHNSILSAKGTVLLENLTINNKTNNGGKLVFTGLATAKDPRHTLDPDATRTVTIKNCTIDSQTNGTMFRTTAPVAISNSTVKTIGRAPLFEGSEKDTANAPVIEGEYSAIAGLKANVNKPNKLKEYNPKKLTSYTYIYIVPGTVDLLPTETTEETVAPTEKPEETKPVETKPEETKPAETKPEATKPAETKPEATKPAETKPEETKPEETKPEETKPEETKPEETKPEETKPEETAPEATKPEETTPEASTPEESKPEATAPEASTPADDDAKEEKSGSPLKVILIVLIVLVVVAGAAVGVIFYLRNKNAEPEEEDEE